MAAPAIPDAKEQDSPFWKFSLGFYRGAGVSEACLVLQDEDDVDVNLMLFLMWLASRNRSLSRDDLERVRDAIAPWQRDVVAPIRALRRMLKGAPPLVAPGVAELFRTRVKGLELESEKLQQEAMYRLADTLLDAQAATPRAAAQASVAAYEALAGRSFSQSAVATLLARLDDMDQSR